MKNWVLKILEWPNIRKTNGLEGEARSSEMIVSKKMGQSTGASYEWLDAGATLQHNDVYILEIVKSDGTTEPTIIDLFNGGMIYMPILTQ
ncbi:MAG: hypothetical protein AAF702_28775 [Chloroflexota bacterium]